MHHHVIGFALSHPVPFILSFVFYFSPSLCPYCIGEYLSCDIEQSFYSWLVDFGATTELLSSLCFRFRCSSLRISDAFAATSSHLLALASNGASCLCRRVRVFFLFAGFFRGRESWLPNQIRGTFLLFLFFSPFLFLCFWNGITVHGF